MPFFFIVERPTESGAAQGCQGPYDTAALAEKSRAQMIEDDPFPGAVFHEVQEQPLSWYLARPVPQTTISQDDGSLLEIWTDGSQRIIPAE